MREGEKERERRREKKTILYLRSHCYRRRKREKYIYIYIINKYIYTPKDIYTGMNTTFFIKKAFYNLYINEL